MKTVGFSVSDRQYAMALLQFSPAGSRIKATLVFDMFNQFDYKPAEIEELGIKDDENGFITAKKNKIIDVNLTDEQIAILKECILLADQQEAIHYSMIPLIERIETL